MNSERVDLDVINNNDGISKIVDVIDRVHEETKKQQEEIDALDELDVLLRRLTAINTHRKEKTKEVKRRMRILDQNL